MQLCLSILFVNIDSSTNHFDIERSENDSVWQGEKNNLNMLGKIYLCPHENNTIDKHRSLQEDLPMR